MANKNKKQEDAGSGNQVVPGTATETETGSDEEDEANEAAEEEEEDHEINKLSNVELIQLLDDKLDNLEQSNEDFKSAITEQIEGLSTRMSNLEDSSEELQDDVTEMALDEHYDDDEDGDEDGDSDPDEAPATATTARDGYPRDETIDGNYPTGNGKYPADSNGNYPTAQTVTVDENALSISAVNDQISNLTAQLQNATAAAAQAHGDSGTIGSDASRACGGASAAQRALLRFGLFPQASGRSRTGFPNQ